MDTAHIEGLIGMLTVLAILALLVLPSVLGIARDRRIDRQIREADRARQEAAGSRPRTTRPRYFTSTVTHHS
ncbi:hypothetical protein ACWC09_45520 [Streptomyces sp. NPDC001617]